MFKKWLVNILISIDQFGNAITGGDPDETISSRIGRFKSRHGGKIPWRHPLPKAIDWLLDRIDRDHTIEAIEHDEGHDSLDESERPKAPPSGSI